MVEIYYLSPSASKHTHTHTCTVAFIYPFFWSSSRLLKWSLWPRPVCPIKAPLALDCRLIQDFWRSYQKGLVLFHCTCIQEDIVAGAAAAILPSCGTCKALVIFSIQLRSVAKSCLTPCDPMKCSMPGLPVHHQIPESTKTRVYWVSDAIQPSHPLSPPSPSALNLSQDQGLSKWLSSLHEVAKVLEFQLQHQSFQWTPTTDLL